MRRAQLEEKPERLQLRVVYTLLVREYKMEPNVEVPYFPMRASGIFSAEIKSIKQLVENRTFIDVTQEQFIQHVINVSHLMTTKHLALYVKRWSDASESCLVSAKDIVIEVLKNPGAVDAKKLERLAKIFVQHGNAVANSILPGPRVCNIANLAGVDLEKTRMLAGKRAAEIQWALGHYYTHLDDSGCDVSSRLSDDYLADDEGGSDYKYNSARPPLLTSDVEVTITVFSSVINMAIILRCLENYVFNLMVPGITL